MGNAKGADNCICPFISLPNSWDQYLACLGSNMRQKLRRLLRNVENNPALSITHANVGNIETSIETLIAFWTKKWSDQKGNRLEAMQGVMRAKMRHYFEIGVLYCPVLWRNESPVGIHANLIDSEKRVMHFFVGARDENSDDLQPGFTLHAYSIRHSMEMGLTRYDFLRGNEDYKYSFGSTDRRISNTIIHRRADANDSKVFDARSIPHALRLIKQQRSAGNPVRAEAGYRKILSVGPDCLPAMLGLAEAKAIQGDIMAAERLLRDLVTQQRDSQAAWVALGQCLAAQNCWPEAEACYCRALELNPRFAPAHYHLGVMYEARGSAAQAQRSYKAVIELDPDFRDVKQRLIGCVLKSGRHDGPGRTGVRLR
jgi:tetratricopeptide (TPR) repeat protein